MELGDADLVERVRAGDNDAYRVLVERYGRQLFRVAFRMIGNEEDAKDVVQDALLRAYRGLAGFDQRAQFSSWIYRIVSNQALDYLRVKRRRAENSLSEPPSEGLLSVADRIPGDVPDPERLASSGQLQGQLLAVLDELTPQERVAFTLRHFEDQSIDQISRGLDISAGAARHAVFRAVHKVRKMLQTERRMTTQWRT